jgi:hypothetical protein
MAYSGENVVEHMVPLDPMAELRIRGFYTEIGWEVLSSENGLMLNAVPETGEDLVEGIGYWRTNRQHRLAWFEDHSDPSDPESLSKYTLGLRLARLMDLIERPLVLPTDDHLSELIERGGDLLERHTHIPLRQHAGRWETRIIDPFLYVIRVTGPRKSE